MAECEEGITASIQFLCVNPISQGRSKNVAECEEGITASIQFLKDVVRTWLSVKRVLLRPSNFSSGKNWLSVKRVLLRPSNFSRT